jgi:aspartate/tyrosine/aromatic aminotransferase
MRVNELRTERHAEFKNLRTEMQAEFKNVRAEINDLRIELVAAMKAEGETTRRHFDVVAEQFRDFTKVLADGIARNTERPR